VDCIVLHCGYIGNAFIVDCESFHCGLHSLIGVWLGWGAGAPVWRQALWGCCPRRSVCRALRPGADQGDKRVATWRLVCPSLDAGADQERTWRLISFLLGAVQALHGAWAAYTFSIIVLKIFFFSIINV
jgi:hypothetical protein